MLIKALRQGLGMIIVMLDWLTRPKSITRSVEQQNKAQGAMQGLSLFQLYACPFCVKTRRALHRLGVNVEIKDIGKNTEYRQTLEQGGGRIKVPCLRIEEEGKVRWMYESNDIVSFLEQRIDNSAA